MFFRDIDAAPAPSGHPTPSPPLATPGGPSQHSPLQAPPRNGVQSGATDGSGTVPSGAPVPAVFNLSLHHKLSPPPVNLRHDQLLPVVRPSQHSRGKPLWTSIEAGLLLRMASTHQFLEMSHRHGGPMLLSVPAHRYLRPSK